MTVQDATPIFTQREIREAQRTLAMLAEDYHGEIPTRIHTRDHGQAYGLGSAPPFAPEFIGYIGKLLCKNPNCSRCRRTEKAPVTDGYKADVSPRTRATRAFRKLRRAAPLEFDVVRMAVVYGLTVRQITHNLNARAIEKDYPERYTVQDTLILAMAGIDKLGRYF